MKEIKIGKITLPIKVVFWCAAAFAFNFLVIFFTRWVNADVPKHDLSLPLDRRIPFLPGMILIYWGCCPFWVATYLLAMRYDKGRGYRFILAHFMADTACFAFFLLLPTGMVRPEPTGRSLAAALARLTYRCDAPDNLFPSIHCYISWLCWIGVRKNPAIPRWYRVLSLVMAMAVCVSTLTVKQHVLVDVPAGILLAELCYALAGWVEKRWLPNPRGD